MQKYWNIETQALGSTIRKKEEKSNFLEKDIQLRIDLNLLKYENGISKELIKLMKVFFWLRSLVWNNNFRKSITFRDICISNKKFFLFDKTFSKFWKKTFYTGAQYPDAIFANYWGNNVT